MSLFYFDYGYYKFDLICLEISHIVSFGSKIEMAAHRVV